MERITYQSDGYSVLKCAAKGHTDLVAVVGMMPDTHVGSVLTLGGHWKIDSKYGRQFEVVTFEETLPATVYGIEKYLGSGLMALSGASDPGGLHCQRPHSERGHRRIQYTKRCYRVCAHRGGDHQPTEHRRD